MVVSVGAAALAHGLLIALSPRLPILQARSTPAKEYSFFKVHVGDDVPPPPPAAPPDATRAPATVPGDMSDLLERETEALMPSESLLQDAVEIPNVDERVASDPIDREYSMEPNPDILSRLDAKVLEISQDVARDDIQVARREVAPSSNRLVGENEFPVLRSPLDESPAEVLMMEPSFSPPSALGPLQDGAAPDTIEKPPVEEGVVAPAPEEGLPEMPKEIEVARAPVLAEVKSENTNEYLDDLVEIALDTYVPPGEKEGFFRVRILPRANQKLEVLPKDITYVIDASNSILQRKLDKTLEGVARSVQLLRPEDLFNIVIFRDGTSSFQQDRVAATPQNIQAAVAFLKGQESKGQTDVYQAMVPVVESSKRRGVPGMVVVMSDGRPTTGVRDGRTIINALTDENNDDKSIYAIGGGNTVNRYLLDLLAYRNKGESFVSPDFSTMDQDLPKVLAALNDPLLTDLQSDYGRVDESQVFPREVPDFFRDKAVTVYGRFNADEDKDFSMRLSGAAQDTTKEVIFRANLEDAKRGDEAIARAWAFQKTYYLIGEICRVGETPELVTELRELSQKYRIRTSYSE